MQKFEELFEIFVAPRVIFTQCNSNSAKFSSKLTTEPDEMYSVLTKLLSQGWVDGALGCLLAAGIGPSLDHSTTKYVLPTMCEYQGGRQHH